MCETAGRRTVLFGCCEPIGKRADCGRRPVAGDWRAGPRSGAGVEVAPRGAEALSPGGAGRTGGPTLPGGLVVRIRRSHRRGPGSIPGQGSLSSSFFFVSSPPTDLPRTCTHLPFSQGCFAQRTTCSAASTNRALCTSRLPAGGLLLSPRLLPILRRPPRSASLSAPNPTGQDRLWPPTAWR